MPSSALPADLLEPTDFDELDAILDDMRSRLDETPQWEFCEGFMAAAVCSRRPLPLAEYLPVLLGLPAEGEAPAEGDGSFANDAQRERFTALWLRRLVEVQTALDSEVTDLEDDRCYHPEVTDQRAAVAELPPEERAQFDGEALPSFAQVWGLGFMFAVESWPDEWTPPRDKELASQLDDALQSIVAITEDDTEEATISPLLDGGPPSTSLARINALADAIWAVYDLRTLWRSVGPRIATVRKEAGPGRNDACSCGSGKKFKKCCGQTA